MKHFQIQTEIEGITLDFLLTMNEKGEVTAVKSMLYELPEVTQKLILGDKKDTLHRQIKAYARMVNYIIPLVWRNRLDSHQDAYAEVVEYLNSLGIEKKPLKEDWSIIEFLIENKNSTQSGLYNNIRRLGSYHKFVATEFLPVLIPFIHDNAKRIAFEVLKNGYPNFLQSYLIEELENPQSAPYASGILTALTGITTASNDIFEAVIKYYHRKGEKTEDTLAKITEVLQKYPYEQSKNIGLEILKKNARHSSGYAAKLLIKTFNAHKEVADIMLPYFLAADPRTSEAAYSIFCNNASSLAEFLPEPEVLLDIFVKTLSKGRNLNISHLIPFLSKVSGVAHMYEQLYELLDHESPAVREGILIIINRYFDDPDYAKYQSPIFVEKFEDLVFDENEYVVRNALIPLSKIGQSKNKAEYIDQFLEVINKNDKNGLVRLEAMRAINSILEKKPVPYQPQIESAYLKALEENNYNYRIEALKGLGHSPKIERELLLKYQNDSEPAVKNLATRLLNQLF